MRIRILLAAICLPVLLFAGDDKRFPVSEIPENLKKDANAVVRLIDETYEIQDLDKAVHTVRYAITILSEKADRMALVYEQYDKLSKVQEFAAWVYDADGNEVAKLKKTDIKDQSNVSGASLFEDNRIKYADMSRKEFPYTVYSEIRTTYDYVYFIPPFVPVPDENVSVMRAFFTLRAPESLFPRFKEINVNVRAEMSSEADGMKSVNWIFSDLPVIEAESYGFSWREKVPLILSAPTRFRFEGYEGDMSTWDSFGQWINTLNADRNTLPEATVSKLREMTKGMTTREKIDAVYDYMQNRTRYVSIQLGIGGFQPFESGLVDEVGYGDCKALTFYTKSMLEAVGISSNYTLVYAGADPWPIYEDFPASTFNHVILAVPMEKDTVWLECTSQIQPNGFLGSFTHDREALMITDNGAAIVKTPVYDHNVNTERRNAVITLEEDGNATASVTTQYSGILYEYSNLEGVLHLGTEDQKEWIHRVTKIPHYELRSFSMENNESLIPYAEVTMELALPKYSSASGKRMFFQPNLMNKFSNPLPKTEERTEIVRISRGFRDVDSITFEFPSHLRPEYLPEPVSIENQFGSYRFSCEFIQGKLQFFREFIIYKGEYPPEAYQDLFGFFNMVEREDKKKVVLLNGT